MLRTVVVECFLLVCIFMSDPFRPPQVPKQKNGFEINCIFIYCQRLFQSLYYQGHFSIQRSGEAKKYNETQQRSQYEKMGDGDKERQTLS